MATRKDSRGYSLKKGESQRKDGRYVFRYTTIRGEHRAVYAKDLKPAQASASSTCWTRCSMLFWKNISIKR